MEITVGAWFSEPKIAFKFSHKVSLFIRDQIKQCIMNPLGLLDSLPGKFLHLTVATKSTQDILEVKLGPRWRKNSVSRNHALWFPYHRVVDSDCPVAEYISLYSEALAIIFKEWGVTESQIALLKENCLREIIGNPIYELTDAQKEEYERSDRFTEQIEKEYGKQTS